jgi:hypothetical protein
MQRSRLVLVGMFALVAALGPAARAGGADGPRERTTPIVVRVNEGGFRWTDAAVGAAAGIGATLVAAGGVALVRVRQNEKGVRP